MKDRVVAKHRRTNVGRVDKVRHRLFRLGTIEANVPNGFTRRPGLKFRSVRPVSNARNENVGPRSQHLRRIDELSQTVGAAMGAGVQDNDAIPPSKLGSDCIVAGSWGEQTDIRAVRNEDQLFLRNNAALQYVVAKRRREHVYAIGGAVTPSLDSEMKPGQTRPPSNRYPPVVA